MHKINEYAQRLQDLLGTTAETIAKKTQFIQRNRKITAFAWLLATVLGWMNNKTGTLSTIVEHFEQQGIAITEQAVSKRFSTQAVEFFKQMIAQACILLAHHRPENLPLTQRFNGVYVEDCSTVRLPSDLIGELPGCGGSGSEKKGAAIKTFCRIELLCGNFSELIFGAGKTSDIKLANQARALPKGALRLADMGFFDVDRFRQEDALGIYWITRIPAGTLIEIDGIQQSIGTYLSSCKGDRVDVSAFLCKERLPVRFIALRAPEQTIRQRHERLQKTAKKKKKKKKRSVSQEQLSLCAWTVFATNLPESEYTADEVYTLYRIRWQIELVFKLWKSEGGVASSHGKTGTRCLCEFLAKLLGQIIANGLMLLRGGRLGEVSPTRLYRQVTQVIPDIAEALGAMDEEALLRAMDKLVKRLERIKPKQKRKKQPSTRQTLCEKVIYTLS
jgi:hypothetical protein